MAARQNIIIVIPGDWVRVRGLLERIQPLVEEWIGMLSVLSVQDFLTGSAKDNHIVGGVPRDTLPEASKDEIVALYPDDPKRGAVLVLHEGPYDLIVLATGEHGQAVDRLTKIWRLIGDEARAVLVGEELEVERDQISELLRSQWLSPNLDLCEAAIVGCQPNKSGIAGEGLPYSGRLLLRNKQA